MMTRVTRLVVLLCLGMCSAHAVLAQDLTPRAYLITPVGGNALTLAGSHLDGTYEFAGAVPITGAKASINLPVVSYYRSLDFFGRSANLALVVPYGVGDFKGTVVGVPRYAYRSGLLDSAVRFSVNLLGGPAMQPAEFRSWRQTNLLGASLTIVPPSGQYDPQRLINWGTNHWAFKPEIGYSRRLDHWVLDGYGAMWLFTTNPEYYPGESTQTQKPVAAFEGHLSYDFQPRLWVSLDANFWSGGATTVNGVENSLTNQRSSRVGVTAAIPLTAHQSIKFGYSTGAYIRYGGNYHNASLAWQYSWIGRPTFP
jgi:hypothetical protein